MYKAWHSIEEVSYCFYGHPPNFKATRAENRRIESNLSKIIAPVPAVKSLRFALFLSYLKTKCKK